MLKKTVTIDEGKNEIRYYEKDPKSDDYLDTILKYMCSSSDTDEIPGKKEEEYMILKNGKKVYK